MENQLPDAEVQQVVKPTSPGLNTAVRTLLFILIAILAGAVGYYVRYVTETNSLNTPLVVNQEPKTDVQPQTEVKQQPDTDLSDSLPAVVFTPGGLFSESDKQDLYKKVIDPYSDYHTGINLQPGSRLVSISITRLTEGNYKYKIEAIYTQGGTEGFLYGDSKSATVPYWVPGCMAKCSFPAGFEAKYPEVMAEYKKNNP